MIELDHVVKTYGRTTALDGLSLTVGRGELVGLLGPNGAGKTTAIKLLIGLTRPTRGSGRVLGAPLGDRAARARIGYLPELFRYQPWLRAREVLRLHTELAGLAPARRPGAVDDALAWVGLAERADDPVSGFSKGMQQRLGLGVALLGDPELILLDEPTSALDPIGRTDVRAIVRSARDRGATVILNSHLLSEVEQVCDRVVILHQGRAVASGPLEEIVAAGGVRLRVTDLDPAGRQALAAFGAVGIDGEWVAIRPLDRARIPDVVEAIVAAGGRVHAVEPGRGSLEARFLELVTGPPPPAAPTDPPAALDALDAS
ncbi:MAG: ABC transporter ATP-binding protein [Candidatus Limnocylindrales bacterium]|nr:ABC transporter ATP-binding protein [Candidatus Limnocylindrales bacterium]